MDAEKPTILYHYTTMSVLCSLLNNLEYTTEKPSLDSIYLRFWLTQDGYMNDPSERWFFLNSLQNALINYQNKYNLKDKSNLFNVTYSVWDQLEGYKYILSLSDNEDCLSMWRAYGENGKEVAIGLNAEKLENYFKSEEQQWNKGRENKYDKNFFRFVKIKYIPVINHIYSFPEDFLKRIYNSIEVEEDRGSGDMNILEELFNYEKLSYKNDAYWEEREWRLVFISNSPCEFRERNGLIIPYYTLRIPFEAIETIIIGPCTDLELSKSSLSSMIYQKTKNLAGKKEVKLLSSTVPYIQR